MVFQHYALFPHLTVAENIGFGLRARGVSRAAAKAKVEQAANARRLRRRCWSESRTSSQGESASEWRSRARSRASPTSSCSTSRSRTSTHNSASRRVQSSRAAAAVGHDDGVRHPRPGRGADARRPRRRPPERSLQQVGSPDEIYRQPANRFVGRFIGSPAMNLFRARLEDGTLRAGPFTFEPPARNGAISGRQLEVGIRPEHVRVGQSRRGEPAEVEVVEIAGSETTCLRRRGRIDVRRTRRDPSEAGSRVDNARPSRRKARLPVRRRQRAWRSG